MGDVTSEASEDPSDLDAASRETRGSVLGKAHLLLTAFTAGPTTMGLTELSRESGVSKASAHRLAVELAGLGLLTRTPGVTSSAGGFSSSANWFPCRPVSAR